MQYLARSEGTHLAAREEIPELDALASNGQQFAVRRKRSRPSPHLVSDSTDLLPGCKLPEAGGAILAGRNHLLAIRCDNDGENAPFMPLPLPAQSSSKWIPGAKKAIVVHRSCQQRFSIRSKGQRSDHVGVPRIVQPFAASCI